MSRLTKQGFSAVKWGALSSVARFGLQVFAQAVMARALGPEIYGVFGMGLVVLTFANFFAEFGFGWSLIYRKTLQAEDIRFAFTCQLISGAAVACALFAGAGSIALYFHEPRVELVVQWIAVTCLISAATAPSTNLMARDLRFRESGSVQVASYFVGYVLVGIPLALGHFGVTALIASWVTQSVVRLLGSYWLTRHPVRLLFWHADGRGFLASGSTVFVTNITNWLLNNIDRMLVGRMLSASSMGLYTVGANLANTPNGLLLMSIQPAFLAAGAKMGGDTEQLRSAYRKVLSATLVLTLPIYVMLAAVSHSIVAVLYGSRWEGSASVLSILFLSMPAFIVFGISTPILWNTGRSSHEASLQWPLLLLSGLALILFAHLGTVVVASITAATLALRGIVLCLWACRAIGLSPGRCASDFARGLFLAAVSGGVATGLQLWFGGLPAMVTLLASALGSGLVVVGLVLWKPWLLGDSGCAVLIRMSPKLRRWLGDRSVVEEIV